MTKSNKQPSLFDLTGFDQTEKRKQYEDKIFGAIRPDPKQNDKCWYYDGSRYVLMIVTGISKSGKTFRCIEYKPEYKDKNLLCAWDVSISSFKPFSTCPLTPIF